ncbi:hypothetical protein D3C75_1093080 [compost metagenome]
MFAEEVHAFDDALLDISRKIGLGVVFVHQGDVVKLVNLFLQHLAHAMIKNYRKLTRECRVVRSAVWYQSSHQMAAAILMLQTFPSQGCTACCGAKQKASGPLVSRRPNKITYSLKSEH